MSGLVSAVTLPASAFLIMSSACLMTTGQLNAEATPATPRSNASARLTAFMAGSLARSTATSAPRRRRAAAADRLRAVLPHVQAGPMKPQRALAEIHLALDAGG